MEYTSATPTVFSTPACRAVHGTSACSELCRASAGGGASPEPLVEHISPAPVFSPLWTLSTIDTFSPVYVEA